MYCCILYLVSTWLLQLFSLTLLFQLILAVIHSKANPSRQMADKLDVLPPPRGRRVQFAKTPRPSLISSQSQSTDRPETPRETWRRASVAITATIDRTQKRVRNWKKITDRIGVRRQKEIERELDNFAEVHLPVIDRSAVKRATLKIAERRRIKSAPNDRALEPCQPEDIRYRPSTELKNRLQEYQLPISYNNFIVNNLGYGVLRT